MKNKILISIYTVIVISLLLTSCKKDIVITKNDSGSFIITPNNTAVQLDLRMDRDKKLSSFSIKDDSQNFVLIVNVLEEGDCSLAIKTKRFEETSNVNISDKTDKCISKYITIDNETYLLQDIYRDGKILYQSKIKQTED